MLVRGHARAGATHDEQPATPRSLAAALSKVWDGIPTWVKLATLTALLAFLGIYWGWINEYSYYLRVLATIGLYVSLAVGLNIVAGYAGLLDLGYVAFYGIGAYTYALVASRQFNLHWDFWVVLPVAALLTAGAGVLLGMPVLRLRGDYLAIVTLGFGEIIRIFFNNMDGRTFPINVTNGPDGIVGLDRPRLPLVGHALIEARDYYWLIFGFAIVSLVAAYHMDKSGIGRAWAAIREDELAAEAMGVNTLKYKILAFASGAFFAGAAGCIFAAWQGSAFPNSFTAVQTVNVFAMIVLGGIGSLPGVVAGATVLTVVPEVLRELSAVRWVFYGLMLVLLMRCRPQGLFGSRPRRQHPRPQSRPAAEQEAQTISASHSFRSRTCTSTDKILEIKNLTKRFGGLAAVDNVSFDVKRGEIVSVIGPNGAGKTTLFNLITGIHRPTAGKVNFDGRCVVGLPPHAITARGIARTFQNSRVFANMTVLENVLVGAHHWLRPGVLEAVLQLPSFRKKERRARARSLELLRLIGDGLADRHDDIVITLNYADRRRAEIARALAAEPSLLCLDEPAAGMSSTEARQMTEQIRRLRDSGYTVLLVEHHMPVVMDISDRIIVLDYGRKIAEGSPDQIRSDQRVVEAYLGREGSFRRERGAIQSPTAGETVLKLRDVDTFYGPVQVLRNVNIQVRRGEIICLIGANAAGKTTTLKTILGAVKPSRGSVEYKSRRIDRLPPNEIVRRGIAIVPEGRRIFGRLTVRQNLKMGGFTEENKSQLEDRLARVYDLFPRLKERANQLGGTLSGGEQQMLAIGRGLMADPRLICMDEPSLGLSPILVEVVARAIQDIRQQGTTVFLVEQQASMALAIADRGYVLQTGQIVLEGAADELLAHDMVRRSYLGA